MKSLFALAICALVSFNAHATNDERFEVCRKKLVLSQKLGILHALDWKPPKQPYIVVGKTFFDMPIDAKEGFADALNCFFSAGDTGQCVELIILHWQTGNVAARWSGCKLKVI
jgi:hypothetical protein